MRILLVLVFLSILISGCSQQQINEKLIDQITLANFYFQALTEDVAIPNESKMLPVSTALIAIPSSLILILVSFREAFEALTAFFSSLAFAVELSMAVHTFFSVFFQHLNKKDQG